MQTDVNWDLTEQFLRGNDLTFVLMKPCDMSETSRASEHKDL